MLVDIRAPPRPPRSSRRPRADSRRLNRGRPAPRRSPCRVRHNTFTAWFHNNAGGCCLSILSGIGKQYKANRWAIVTQRAVLAMSIRCLFFSINLSVSHGLNGGAFPNASTRRRLYPTHVC